VEKTVIQGVDKIFYPNFVVIINEDTGRIEVSLTCKTTFLDGTIKFDRMTLDQDRLINLLGGIEKFQSVFGTMASVGQKIADERYVH